MTTTYEEDPMEWIEGYDKENAGLIEKVISDNMELFIRTREPYQKAVKFERVNGSGKFFGGTAQMKSFKPHINEPGSLKYHWGVQVRRYPGKKTGELAEILRGNHAEIYIFIYKGLDGNSDKEFAAYYYIIDGAKLKEILFNKGKGLPSKLRWNGKGKEMDRYIETSKGHGLWKIARWELEAGGAILKYFDFETPIKKIAHPQEKQQDLVSNLTAATTKDSGKFYTEKEIQTIKEIAFRKGWDQRGGL